MGTSLENNRVVRPEYSCSLRKIDMVQAVDSWEFNNVTRFRYSYGATVRRVSTQGLVCSPRMVVDPENRKRRACTVHNAMSSTA